MTKKLLAIVVLCGCLCTACDRTRGFMGKPYEAPEYDPDSPSLDAFHYDRAEWLYFTGIVETDQGKKIGYEVTIFQTSYTEPYTGKFLYVGHVAVSDRDIPEHFRHEVISLPAAAWPVQLGTPQVAIKDFSYAATGQGFTIKVTTDDISLDFSLGIQSPILPQGENGTILMGDGKPSGYYSYTDLSTTGTLTYNGAGYSVTSGRTWMDHQWGNFWMSGMHWNWYSLRFDDGGALMLFWMRGADQQMVRSCWTYRSGAGDPVYGTSCSVTAHRMWRDEKGKATYPLDWTLTIPELDASFEVVTVFDEQRFYDAATPSYWEGWCTFIGTVGASAVSGNAYTELTFYND